MLRQSFDMLLQALGNDREAVAWPFPLAWRPLLQVIVSCLFFLGGEGGYHVCFVFSCCFSLGFSFWPGDRC